MRLSALVFFPIVAFASVVSCIDVVETRFGCALAREPVRIFHVKSFGAAQKLAEALMQQKLVGSVYVIPETLKKDITVSGKFSDSRGTMVLAEVRKEDLEKANEVHVQIVSSYTRSDDTDGDNFESGTDDNSTNSQGSSEYENTNRPRKRDL